MPQCKQIKHDGKTCRARAMRGSDLCVSHNPGAAEVKRAGSSKGGRNRRRPALAPQPPHPTAIRTIDDVAGLLYRTLQELRDGVLDADLARSIGYLAGVTAKVVETVEVARRVATLEDSVLELLEKELN